MTIGGHMVLKMIEAAQKNQINADPIKVTVPCESCREKRKNKKYKWKPCKHCTECKI